MTTGVTGFTILCLCQEGNTVTYPNNRPCPSIWTLICRIEEKGFTVEVLLDPYSLLVAVPDRVGWCFLVNIKDALIIICPLSSECRIHPTLCTQGQ